MVKQTDDARCRLRYFVFRSTLRAFRYDVIMALRSSGHHASAGLEPAQEPLVSTYQTRVADYAGMDRLAGDAALTNYAELYGRVQRKLFADVAAGGSAASLKGAYLQRYGIRARLFNAVRVSLEGKVASVKEQQKLRVDSLRRRIARAERQIGEAVQRGRWAQVHENQRRLTNLKLRLVVLETDIAAGLVRLCFGSKRLWRKQRHLADNGYASHQEWLRDWRDAQFFVLGSRDETAGCQLCVAAVADDGTLTLRLRMPDCLVGQYGKYLVIEGVRFAYGHEQVLAALQSNANYGCGFCRRRSGGTAGARTGRCCRVPERLSLAMLWPRSMAIRRKLAVSLVGWVVSRKSAAVSEVANSSLRPRMMSAAYWSPACVLGCRSWSNTWGGLSGDQFGVPGCESRAEPS